MVPLLLGVPGSGKSYEAVVYHIIPSLQSGRKVITNLPLNLDKFREVFGDDVLSLIKKIEPTSTNPIPFKTLADYGDSWRHQETNIGSLYVIDECHKALPRGATVLKVEEWFAEHRHEGADVLLITQSYGKVSKSIIDIVHIVYRVRKNIALGSTSSYVRKVQDGVRGEVVNTSIRKYKPEFFDFYKSHTKSNHAVDEQNAQDVRPIWRHWTFVLALPMILIGLYFLLSRPAPFQVNAKTQQSLVKNPAIQHSQQTKPTSNDPQQMQSKIKEDDKVQASHPFYKLQMHIGGFIENQIRSRFLYNVILSQNGQQVSVITSDDVMRAGYTVEPLGSCLFKVTYKIFFDYITCDAPRTGENPNKNFNQDSKKS